MTQTEFNLTKSGRTQCDSILRRLQQSPGEWVEMPELYRVSGAFAVHSRISDLRKHGHDIANKSHTVNGIRHSFYKLEVTR